MFNLLSAIKNNLEAPNPIKSGRIFAHTPSSAMCYSALDNSPVGTCIRSAYMGVKSFPASNPMGIYVRMTTEAGKLWENWLVNQYKELGIYVSHSVKLYDETNNMSGEIDIVHMNPLTDEVEITECKQYNGSNYFAQMGIVGSKNQRPTPKESHLLQCFDYLMMCRNTGQNIKFSNLMYLDRSCGSFYNNFQFRISLFETASKQISPLVEYFDSEGNVQSYVDTRITEKGIVEKNKMLDTFLENDLLPPRDYELSYSNEKVELLYKSKQISATKYNKWKEDPVKNKIGDWNCTYCPYGPDLKGFSTCWSLNE